MKCKICHSESKELFRAELMQKHDVQYFHCEHCKFIQTEEPFWLAEAYQRPINISDVGILDRNIFLMKIVSSIIYFCFNKEGIHVDYAGGYGIFTRLMRDIGFDYLWTDPYTKNLFAHGFEYSQLMNQKINTVSAFEAFEHFVDPRLELEKILQVSKNVIFTTQLVPKTVPKPGDWWYYGLEHGQHVSLYSSESLLYLSKDFKLNYYTNGINIHIFTSKKLSKIFLKLIFRFYDRGIFRFVSKRMESKTQSDMNTMINQAR